MMGGIATWFFVGLGLNFFVRLSWRSPSSGCSGSSPKEGFFRFTLDRPNNGFIMSIGLIVILQHVVIRIFNEFQKSIPDPVGAVWLIGGVHIIAMRVVVVAITAVVVAITYFGISRSRYGMALRASVADQQHRRTDGHSDAALRHGVFVYGSILAGLGGALMIALFPITPFVGSGDDHAGFCGLADRWPRQRGGVVGAGLVLGLVDGFSGAYGDAGMDRRTPMG